MVPADIVANYILSLSNPDVGDIISNLKLQKLLYYTQGFHLAIYDTPLFNENVVAWEHGPVVPEIYRRFKDFGSGAIEIPNELDINGLTQDQVGVIVEVYEVYGQFSAWKLANMTHNESPWVETPQNEVISHEILATYFKTQIFD